MKVEKKNTNGKFINKYIYIYTYIFFNSKAYSTFVMKMITCYWKYYKCELMALLKKS